MIRIVFDPALAIRGYSTAELPSIAVEETPVGGSVVDDPITDKDVSYLRRTTTGATNNCRLTALLPFGVSGGQWQSQTPAVCQVDGQGNVSRVANGQGHVTFDSSRGRASFFRNFSTVSSVQRVGSSSYVAGSLGKHVRDAIAAMVLGKTPGTPTQGVLQSSSGDWSAPAHVRNPGLFTGALDLSAISVYTEANASNKYPMVLVSQHHVIGGHAGTYPGKRVVFRGSSGHEVRTVLAQTRIDKATGEDYVGVLDAPILTITPMSLLPSTWRNYWPSYNSDRHTLPVLNKGWTGGDRIRVLENYGGTWAENNLEYLFLRAHTSEFAAWSSAIIGGDSNGPVFIPINGAPVLLHCMNYASGGANYANYSAQIKAAMDAMSTAQSKPTQNLTFASLAGFTAYP